MSSNISINLATSFDLQEPKYDSNDVFLFQNQSEQDVQVKENQEPSDGDLNDDDTTTTSSRTRYKNISDVAVAALQQEQINRRRNAAILADGKQMAIYQTQRKLEERKIQNKYYYRSDAKRSLFRISRSKSTFSQKR